MPSSEHVKRRQLSQDEGSIIFPSPPLAYQVFASRRRFAKACCRCDRAKKSMCGCQELAVNSSVDLIDERYRHAYVLIRQGDGVRRNRPTS